MNTLKFSGEASDGLTPLSTMCISDNKGTRVGTSRKVTFFPVMEMKSN